MNNIKKSTNITQVNTHKRQKRQNHLHEFRKILSPNSTSVQNKRIEKL
jgi:hypothetical protein